jgi:nitroimidazol reductase NimA-like FMN-containing flavoprotein (pyridoxamine 5'-phosphate oxidase superfamily)
MATRDASWPEVADRLAAARSYWLATCDSVGAPHVSPVWGAVVDDELYFFSERRTLKARHIAANPGVAVHLENAEDVVIVRGRLDDVGVPQGHDEILAALRVKYATPEDAQYLPSDDPDFDVLWRLVPERALMWRLDEFDESQARWRAGSSQSH